MLQGVQAVLPQLELFVLLVREVNDQYGRPLLDQADQAHRATGNHVRDEQLLAVDDVVVAVTLGVGL